MKKAAIIGTGVLALAVVIVSFNKKEDMPLTETSKVLTKKLPTAIPDTQHKNLVSTQQPDDLKFIHNKMEDNAEPLSQDGLTLEETIEKARYDHAVESGLLAKHLKSHKTLEQHNKKLQERNSRISHNERAQTLLNIDVKNNFNIDLDKKMEEAQVKGDGKHNLELRKQLAAMGVNETRQNEIIAMRMKMIGRGDIEQ